MEIYQLNAALAGLGYALAALFSKRALQTGSGVLRLAFVTNLLFVPVFAVVYFGGMDPLPASGWHLPAITGLLFFLGQVFTFAAIRMGDVSLQTPVMGTKVMFVVLMAIVLGTEVVGATTIVAAVLSMLAVALLGFSGGGAKRVGLTLVLAMLSALFFAGTDVMVGAFAREFGVRHFVFFTVVVNAVLSFLLVPFFHEPLRRIPRVSWPWTVLAGGGMAAQALLLNYTLGAYQHVAVINVLYSARGLWSVLLATPVALLLGMPRESITRRIFAQRLIGALLLSIAIALVFSE